MMATRTYWGDNENANVKYDNYNPNDGFGRTGELNFAAASEDESEFPPGGGGAYLKKGKVLRQDPMSHRIIEKRRRDRMNNCLADLSRLIPPEYLKKGRGRVEKTEIVEMAIRHIKFLQDRANNLYHAAERSDGFLSGYQEAAAEAVRFLIEVQGYGPGDGLCVQMAAHLHRNCEHLNKAEPHNKPRAFHQSHSHHPGPSGSSSETNSSSSSSHYGVKGVIMQAPPPFMPEPYEPERERNYAMECDRDSSSQLPPPESGIPENEHMTMNRQDREESLRSLRKPDHEDYLQSYKFKNSIERRFSRSQDEQAADMLTRSNYTAAHTHPHPHQRVNFHKRRRAPKALPSTSTSTSGSTEEARDTSPQDSCDSHHHIHANDKFEKPPPSQLVPVFALDNIGKYYVPLNVEYSCLARHLNSYDTFDARAVQVPGPLHPVTIHVNFHQRSLSHLVKKEPSEREWDA